MMPWAVSPSLPCRGKQHLTSHLISSLICPLQKPCKVITGDEWFCEKLLQFGSSSLLSSADSVAAKSKCWWWHQRPQPWGCTSSWHYPPPVLHPYTCIGEDAWHKHFPLKAIKQTLDDIICQAAADKQNFFFFPSRNSATLDFPPSRPKCTPRQHCVQCPGSQGCWGMEGVISAITDVLGNNVYNNTAGVVIHLHLASFLPPCKKCR